MIMPIAQMKTNFKFSSPAAKTSFLDEAATELADRMLSLIQKHTKVDPYRIYMQFTEMTREGAWRYTG